MTGFLSTIITSTVTLYGTEWSTTYAGSPAGFPAGSSRPGAFGAGSVHRFVANTGPGVLSGRTVRYELPDHKVSARGPAFAVFSTSSSRVCNFASLNSHVTVGTPVLPA